MSDLYNTDLVLWSEHQATLLRRLAAGEVVNEPADWSNLAEKIQALGKSQSRELASRIATVLDHLRKLQASPAPEARAGWRATIGRERRDIVLLIADAPSLRRTVLGVIEAQIDGARKVIAEDLADRGEEPVTDLSTLSYTADQIRGDWFPDDPL